MQVATQVEVATLEVVLWQVAPGVERLEVALEKVARLHAALRAAAAVVG